MSPASAKDKFLTIIQENKKLIFKVCNSYCKDEEDRKDLVQEVIIQLWKSFPNYNPQYKLSTWMYRIALNVAISFYRKEHPRKERTIQIDDILINIADDNPQHDLDEKVGLLHTFINQLDELNKALMLLYLDDNSYKEIADILGITETNVATKISRIKQRLKQQFTNTSN
jgi:RNA polymerase sigma-70 factor (ECF subfamily)